MRSAGDHHGQLRLRARAGAARTPTPRSEGLGNSLLRGLLGRDLGVRQPPALDGNLPAPTGVAVEPLGVLHRLEHQQHPGQQPERLPVDQCRLRGQDGGRHAVLTDQRGAARPPPVGDAQARGRGDAVLAGQVVHRLPHTPAGHELGLPPRPGGGAVQLARVRLRGRGPLQRGVAGDCVLLVGLGALLRRLRLEAGPALVQLALPLLLFHQVGVLGGDVLRRRPHLLQLPKRVPEPRTRGMRGGLAREHPAQEVGEAHPGRHSPAAAGELHQPLSDREAAVGVSGQPYGGDRAEPGRAGRGRGVRGSVGDGEGGRG